jgi:hypothetical protein
MSRGRPRRLRASIIALLALALMATLAPVNAYAAPRAPSKATADRLAKQLLKKQLKDASRQLVEARITLGVKNKRRGQWEYLYDDLSRNGDVCTALIVVKFKSQTSSTIRAGFSDSNCENPGDEVLAFRTATRAYQRAEEKAAPALRRALRRFTSTLGTCDKIKSIPADRKDQADSLITADLLQSVIGPLGPPTDSFASALQAVGATDTQLAAGAAAWRDFVDASRALPAIDPDACSLLREWEANNWTPETAPVDFATLDPLMTRIGNDLTALKQTGRYLVRRGLDPVTASTFGGEDVLALLTLPTADSGSGSSKLAPRTLVH